VHRDIKPDNIMLREDGRTPVIVDFGLVRMLDEPSITGSWADRGPGTPFYASPEQLRNEKPLIDWRSDQFSLGVSLSRVTIGVHTYQQIPDEDPLVSERRLPVSPASRSTPGATGSSPFTADAPVTRAAATVLHVRLRVPYHGRVVVDGGTITDRSGFPMLHVVGT
jgi:serine/threonine protein kinase